MEHDNTGPATGSLLKLTVAASYASVLTKNIAAKDPNRGLCGRCGGKKFDVDVPAARRVSSRKCPVCKGAGTVQVGSTKR